MTKVIQLGKWSEIRGIFRSQFGGYSEVSLRDIQKSVSGILRSLFFFQPPIVVIFSTNFKLFRLPFNYLVLGALITVWTFCFHLSYSEYRSVKVKNYLKITEISRSGMLFFGEGVITRWGVSE